MENQPNDKVGIFQKIKDHLDEPIAVEAPSQKEALITTGVLGVPGGTIIGNFVAERLPAGDGATSWIEKVNSIGIIDAGVIGALAVSGVLYATLRPRYDTEE